MFLLQQLINGVMLGGVYGVAAVGFALVWGVMNEINIAHAAFMVIGAYTSFFLFTTLHVDPLASIVVAMAVAFALAYPIQRYLLNRALPHGLVITLATTFGLNLFLENVVRRVFSSDYRSISPSYITTSFSLGPLTLPLVPLLVFVLAVAFTAGLHLFLERSSLGLAIRATALNRVAARIVGIPVQVVYAFTFALGAALAAASGTMIGTLQSIYPGMGDAFLTKVFVITALGGFGSIPGALVGSLILSLVEVLSATYLSPNIVDFVAFSLLVVVLVVRPQGLFGKRFYGEEASA
ncbi:MAG TPA: branched-chain amino acid ABC transporter permease [Trueperaceae bacterium]|nr:branched-chain amino acid ABC transporter permease [Trueperaceae bacterium]